MVDGPVLARSARFIRQVHFNVLGSWPGNLHEQCRRCLEPGEQFSLFTSMHLLCVVLLSLTLHIPCAYWWLNLFIGLGSQGIYGGAICFCLLMLDDAGLTDTVHSLIQRGGSWFL